MVAESVNLGADHPGLETWYCSFAIIYCHCFSFLICKMRINNYHYLPRVDLRVKRDHVHHSKVLSGMMMTVMMVVVMTTVMEPVGASAVRATEGQRAPSPASIKYNMNF